MNATMSAGLLLGVAAAAYGTYYYFYEYQDGGTATELKVDNNSSKDLKIWVDNVLVGTVAKGAEASFAVAPGSHNLGAGVDTATITSTQNIPQGTIFTWTLTD